MSDQMQDEGAEPVVDNPDPGGFYLPDEGGPDPSAILGGKTLEEFAADADAKLREAQERANMTSVLSRIDATLTKPAPAAIAPYEPLNPTMPQVDFNALMAEYDKDQYNPDPSKRVLKLVDPLVQARTAQLAAQVASQGRQLLRMDPKLQPVFERFEPEIEAQAKILTRGQPVDFEVYRQAALFVKANHLDDFIETEIQRRAASAAQGAPAPALASAPSRPAPRVPAGFAQGNGTPAARAPVTAEQLLAAASKKWGVSPGALQQYADRRGLTDYSLSLEVERHLANNTRPF